MSVCAVIVTHNRLGLLRECLRAVLDQTRPPDEVLVVDNASTDGTAEAVRAEFPGVVVLALTVNGGGAAGFHAGLEAGAARGPEWLWTMDDDTIPRPDALERLLAADARLAAAGAPPPAILASKVVWTDGRVHPMNWPGPSFLDFDAAMDAVEHGLMRLRSATFPSLLLRAATVARHGLPRAGFFIWSDDIEFTMRVLRREPGFLVPDSVAVHKTRTAHAPWHMGDRFYFAVRNGIWTMRTDAMAGREKIQHVLTVGGQTQRFLAHERLRPRALRIVLRGLRDGLLRPVPG